MRAFAALVAGFVGLVVVACAGSGEELVPGEDAFASPDDVAASMEVRVTASQVRLALHATNHGSSPISFTFPTSQRHDFSVEAADGTEVWRWSEGMAFTQVISEATLAPGETWEFAAEWEPAGRSGRFVATGWLTASDRELVQRTTFEVP